MACESIATCEHCEKPFKETPGKANRFCCKECYFRWKGSNKYDHPRKAQISGNCNHCGKDVYGKSETIGAGGQKLNVYCNKECYDAYRAKPPDVELVCKGCGDLFTASAKEKNKIYCTVACRLDSQRPESPHCQVCGVWFTGVAFRKNGYVAIVKKKTCGQECLRKFYREDEDRKKKIGAAHLGPKSPSWQGGSGSNTYRGSGWSGIAKKIRKRDKHTCQQCGKTEEENGNALQVHHKVPFHQFGGNTQKANKTSNLISLCKPCHTLADWEWRQNNDVQMVLAFEGGCRGIAKPRAPSDLTGVEFHSISVTGRAPDTTAKDTRWHYDCLRCGGQGIAWRQSIIKKKFKDCGCSPRERKSSCGRKWWVEGKPYRTQQEAALEFGVTGSTIGRWCRGWKACPPKENCKYE